MDFLNDYKNTIIESAEEYVNEYYHLEEDLKTTRSELSRYPRVTLGLPIETINKIELLRDKQNSLENSYARYRSTKGGEFIKRLEAISVEAQGKIAAAFVADVSKIDTGTIELLKAGICEPLEYEAFMEKALKNNNSTMIRLIAKYADEEAKKYESVDSLLSRRFARVANNARYADGSAYADSFKTFVDIVKRISQTPSLYRSAQYHDLVSGYSFGNR